MRLKTRELRVRQERIRYRSVKRQTRLIRRLTKSNEKISHVYIACRANKVAIVQVGEKKFRCRRVVKSVRTRRSMIKTIRSMRRSNIISIRIARRKHIKAFKNVKSVDTKKFIIARRIEIKRRANLRSIERLNIKVLRLRSEKQTSAGDAKIARIEVRISKLKLRVASLKTEEAKVKNLTVENCNKQVICDGSLHKILNIIHINVVRSENGFWYKLEGAINNTFVGNDKNTKVVFHDSKEVEDCVREENRQTVIVNSIKVTPTKITNRVINVTPAYVPKTYKGIKIVKISTSKPA